MVDLSKHESDLVLVQILRYVNLMEPEQALEFLRTAQPQEVAARVALSKGLEHLVKNPSGEVHAPLFDFAAKYGQTPDIGTDVLQSAYEDVLKARNLFKQGSRVDFRISKLLENGISLMLYAQDKGHKFNLADVPVYRNGWEISLQMPAPSRWKAWRNPAYRNQVGTMGDVVHKQLIASIEEGWMVDVPEGKEKTAENTYLYNAIENAKRLGVKVTHEEFSLALMKHTAKIMLAYDAEQLPLLSMVGEKVGVTLGGPYRAMVHNYRQGEEMLKANPLKSSVNPAPNQA